MRQTICAAISLAIMICFSNTHALSTPQSETVPASNSSSLQKWFCAYDDIRRSAKITPQEKRDGNVLMLRALAGNCAGAERDAAISLLRAMRQKYKEAGKQLRQLPATSGDVEPLRTGSIAYYAAAADLCAAAMDSSEGLTEDQQAAKIALLYEQKCLLDELDQKCRLAEALIRRRKGLAGSASKKFFVERNQLGILKQLPR